MALRCSMGDSYRFRGIAIERDTMSNRIMNRTLHSKTPSPSLIETSFIVGTSKGSYLEATGLYPDIDLGGEVSKNKQ